MNKKEKKIKSKKEPFYMKPLQKLLEKSTNMTLSYLYEYSKKFYNENLTYEEWLLSVKNFMSELQKGADI